YDVGPVGAWFDLGYTFEVAKKAEEAGFDAVWFGDHFLPWFHTNAHSPQAWIWLATAASKTKSVPVGSDVTVPMFKYHPLIVGQAFSTLARINPGRVLLGVGTGEAINEAPFVKGWPAWKARAEMLAEAVDLMRKYWAEDDYFGFHGKYFDVEAVHCYDRPPGNIPIYWSAYGPKSASLGGLHGDHVMTSGTPEMLKATIFPRFIESAKSAGHREEDVETCVYVDGGYGDPKKLVSKYRFTAGSLVPENFDVRDPRRIEESAKKLTDEWLFEHACLVSSPDRLIDVIESYRKAGMNHFLFGDWGYDPSATIDVFREKILPYYGVGQKR
ncbi:MAG: LLM class flavin-dependent oxidoreductase, partial [Nitrososphaerota archaeon]|nr:LLM class flavin-dependent oxidoreductase [Nitrososphaerota archaeon]